MGRRVIASLGAAALLLGLLLMIGACENPLLGTVQQIYTSFHSKLVQANFSSNNAIQYFDPGIGNITVDFTDQSIGGITSYDWDFGVDPPVHSTLPNPSHTYYVEGYYTVSLTVSGPDGDSTEIKEDFVAAYSATPLVNIYTPDDNAWVTGTVAVQANADFPPEPIINVQFFVNNILADTDTTEPYSFSWDTSPGTVAENTPIALKAVANTGSVSGTDDDTAVLVDKTAPSVTLTAPSGGSVSGSVSMTATLTDGYSGPNRVEFYVDGSRRYTDYTAGYAYTWNARFYPEGKSHTLLARGFDEVGLSADDSTSVTIDNLGDYNPVTLIDVLIGGKNNKIAVDASLDDDVVVVACEDTDNGIIWLSVSTDAGASFDAHYKVFVDDKFKPANPAVAYEPDSGLIFLTFLQDADGDGRKDVVLLRSDSLGADWEPILFNGDEPFIDGPDSTALALDVQGTYLGLLFDAGDRALYLAYSPDLGNHTTYKGLTEAFYPRDLSLSAYGGRAYLSCVNGEDLLLFTTADLESGKLISELQRLAEGARGHSSTALSPDGKMVGVAFTDRYANPALLLAESENLVFDPVEKITDSGDCAYTALTLGIEKIRLAYTSEKYGLRLAASQVGKYWISYTVEEGPFAHVSMAADGHNQVHIGYYNLDERQERFAAVPFNW
jgi:PKD repeat protein